jgi:hypothetical protein
MATTSKGLRYPVAGDNPAVHTDIQNLASDVDTLLDTYIGQTNLVSIVFEGSTPDGNETTLTVTDPTADRTVTIPDVTGTIITTGNLTGITTLTGATITSGTLGSNLAAGSNKITGLGDASEATDTDAVNVKTNSALNLARTQMFLLGGM